MEADRGARLRLSLDASAAEARSRQPDHRGGRRAVLRRARPAMAVAAQPACEPGRRRCATPAPRRSGSTSSSPSRRPRRPPTPRLPAALGPDVTLAGDETLIKTPHADQTMRVEPLPEFLAAGAKAGIASIVLDNDGTLRRVPRYPGRLCRGARRDRRRRRRPKSRAARCCRHSGRLAPSGPPPTTRRCRRRNSCRRTSSAAAS